MEFLILQSKKDPDFFIITDARNRHRAVDEYRDSQPGDELIDAADGIEPLVMASIPNLSVVRSFIDLIGYFGHVLERPRSWPTPLVKPDAAAG